MQTMLLLVNILSSIDSAVDRQMISDVPVGIFLSGGLDSSTIAASVARSERQSIKCFTSSFDFDKGVNEILKARKVTKHLGLEHFEINISGYELIKVIEELSIAHDDPFADAANIPLYLMSKKLSGRNSMFVLSLISILFHFHFLFSPYLT